MMTLPTDAPTVAEAWITHDFNRPIAATSSLHQGQVIFYETAFVSSVGSVAIDDEHEEECEDEDCDGCLEVADIDEQEEEEMSAEAVDEFQELMEFCSQQESLCSVDLSKHLFKLFHLHDMDSTSLNSILSISAVSTDAHREAAAELRANFPAVVPLGLSTEDVIHLISVLHKCCIPLDEINGTGLFLYVSQLQHSCTPNACFTDAGDSLWVTAIKPISVGEPITVDFFSLFYQPVAERKRVLSEANYSCQCELCEGIVADKTRAFKCVRCVGGIVHPTNDEYSCGSCGDTWGNESIDQISKEEARLMEQLEIYTALELENVIETSPLHRYHHIFFATFSNLMNDSVDENMTPEEGLQVYRDLLTSLNYVIDYPHAQKIQLLDLMARTCIGKGDINEAMDFYTKAFQLSCQVFGSTCGETQLFKHLMEHTPKTVEEMALLYGFQDNNEEEEEEDI